MRPTRGHLLPLRHTVGVCRCHDPARARRTTSIDHTPPGAPCRRVRPHSGPAQHAQNPGLPRRVWATSSHGARPAGPSPPCHCRAHAHTHASPHRQHLLCPPRRTPRRRPTPWHDGDSQPSPPPAAPPPHRHTHDRALGARTRARRPGSGRSTTPNRLPRRAQGPPDPTRATPTPSSGPPPSAPRPAQWTCTATSTQDCQCPVYTWPALRVASLVRVSRT